MPNAHITAARKGERWMGPRIGGISHVGRKANR